MKYINIKKIIFSVLIILFGINYCLKAQNNIIPNYIEDEIILEKGIFLITANVKISQSGSLIIRNGAELKFFSATSIIVEGSLKIIGEPNNFIKISSKDLSSEGFGFEFDKLNNSEIEIQFAEFSNLIMPLKFNSNWGRKNVKIENNMFHNNNSGESSIVILSPDVLLENKAINFSFSKNIFASNQSNIYIDQLESEILNFSFLNNVITDNYYEGYEMGGAFNAPIFSTFDSHDKKYHAIFSENSIFHNYLINNRNDTIISEINFGIQGIGEKYTLGSNYFGTTNESLIFKSFDNFLNNNSSPLIELQTPLNSPSENAPGHIYKILIKGNEVDYNTVFKLNKTDSIHLYFNKAISQRLSNLKLSYAYFDTLSNRIILKTLTNSHIRFKTNLKEAYVVITGKSRENYTSGFIILDGLKDNDGFIIPEINIGKNSLYRELCKQNIPVYYSLKNLSDDEIDSLFYILPRTIESIECLPTNKLIAKDEEIIKLRKKIDSLKIYSFQDSIVGKKLPININKTFEIGFRAGKAMYFGDLQSFSKIYFNDVKNSFGLLFRYNLNPKWTARASLNYLRVKASDANNLIRFKPRQLSFVNDIFEFALQAEYNLVPNLFQKSVIPSISFGLAVFYHNPKVIKEKVEKAFKPFLGRDYYYIYQDLRPLGTAGKKNAYSTIILALPIDFDFKWSLSRNWIIGLQFGTRMTFTDYLDDVAGDPWVSQKELNDMNPELSGLAGRLGNPANAPNPNTYNYPTRGESNGFINKFDWYFFTGITISHIIR
ncbi:MAG: hypothetical protein JEY97_11120 [Bacteroidales bacterium]|nr:hypothetical protein [Bacteroidales bacterium]